MFVVWMWDGCWCFQSCCCCCCCFCCPLVSSYNNCQLDHLCSWLLIVANCCRLIYCLISSDRIVNMLLSMGYCQLSIVVSRKHNRWYGVDCGCGCGNRLLLLLLLCCWGVFLDMEICITAVIPAFVSKEEETFCSSNRFANNLAAAAASALASDLHEIWKFGAPWGATPLCVVPIWSSSIGRRLCLVEKAAQLQKSEHPKTRTHPRSRNVARQRSYSYSYLSVSPLNHGIAIKSLSYTCNCMSSLGIH